MAGTRHSEKSKLSVCRRKRGLASKAHGEKVMAWRISQGAYPPSMNVYRCRHCKLWHVGHVSDPRRIGRHGRENGQRLRNRTR